MLTGSPFRQQSGSILLISLILLSALSILGVSSMRSALTEEKIAGNLQDLHLATESAQSALRDAQRRIRITSDLETENGFYRSVGENTSIPDLTTWTDATSFQVSNNEMARTGDDFDATYDNDGTFPYPRFKLEKFAFQPTYGIGDSTPIEIEASRSNSFYRVIARGVGPSGNNEITLESIIVQGSQ